MVIMLTLIVANVLIVTVMLSGRAAGDLQLHGDWRGGAVVEAAAGGGGERGPGGGHAVHPRQQRDGAGGGRGHLAALPPPAAPTQGGRPGGQTRPLHGLHR